MPDPKTTTPIEANDVSFELTLPNSIDPAGVADFKTKLSAFVKGQLDAKGIDTAALMKFSQISHGQEALLGHDLIRLAESYGMKSKPQVGG